jgi:hypothetical protein
MLASNRMIDSELAELCKGTAGFVLSAPPYVGHSAGIRAMYVLCQDLRRKGFAAFMCGGSAGSREGDAAIVSFEHARELCSAGFVAIYPETVSGNPFGARTVVRWVLNRPGLLGGDSVYDEGEIVFTYSEVYRPYISNAVAGRLYLPIIDHELFWAPPRGDRSRGLTCFYIGKSNWREGVIDRAEALELTRSWPDRSELGKILRRSRALYCFDNSTMLIYEALLCGCPVAVIPDGTQTWVDYLTLELGVDGISWGTDAFTPGEFDASVLRSRIACARAEYHSQLDLLIQMVAKRSAVAPCPNFDSISRLVVPVIPSSLPHLLVRWIRSKLRAAETMFRRARRAAFRSAFGPRRPSQPSELAGFRFDASAVPIPRAGARILNCHVGNGSDAARGRFAEESVSLDPAKPFNPSNVAFLLSRSNRLVLTRRWKSMRQLAERCGCKVVDGSASRRWRWGGGGGSSRRARVTGCWGGNMLQRSE